MNVVESKMGSFVVVVSHEQDRLEAGVISGKDCFRHDSNDPEHPVKTRPRLQNKYNILLACLMGTDQLVGVTVVSQLTSLRLTSSLK